MNEWVSDGMNAVKPKQKVMITSVDKKNISRNNNFTKCHRKKYAYSRP